jgi:type IX secretion system PorP/SprF family membrane protein
MKTNKQIALLMFMLININVIHAQDPSFSQFFSSPLNINPALTANINGKWRVISNYRSQWLSPANPYTTGTISADSKIFQDVVGNYVDENTRVGIGGMMMYDQALGGALKSSYASLNFSGNIALIKKEGYELNGFRIRHKDKASNGEGEQRLGVGLGIIYGNKRIDLSKLTFEEQFTGNGFNTNLPTGESAMATMKPYFSTSAGLLFSSINGSTNFEFGVAAFHLNKPKQTFLSDENQFLAPRYVVHSNYEAFLSDNIILNTNGIYQYQSGASYFSVGGALGYYMPSYDGDRDIIINAGLWYWSKNAIIPYIGFSYGNAQLGITYDITTSDLRQAPKGAQTFELCMILRGNGKKSGVIPAPWK